MAGFRLPRIHVDWNGKSAAGSELEIAADPSQNLQEQKNKPNKSQRPVWRRLLSIRIGGLINLILWCVVIGLLMQFTGYNPYAPPQTGLERAETMWVQAKEAAAFAFRLGWKPALMGASVVLPIWLVWRTLTLPFRK